MKKYKHKYCTQAIQYTGDNAREIVDFLGPAIGILPARTTGKDGLPAINVPCTSFRIKNCLPGDYVIKEADVLVDVIPKELFEKVYEDLYS